jgi:hypothetical protein
VVLLVLLTGCESTTAGHGRNVAEGSEFVYRVAQGRLVVTKDGKQILVDPITATL